MICVSVVFYLTRPSFKGQHEFTQTAKILTNSVKSQFSEVKDIEYFGFMYNFHINVYVKDNLKDNFYESDMIFEFIRYSILSDEKYYDLRKNFYYITSSGAPKYSDSMIDLIEVRITNHKKDNIDTIVNQSDPYFIYKYNYVLYQSYTQVNYDGMNWKTYIKHDKS